MSDDHMTHDFDSSDSDNQSTQHKRVRKRIRIKKKNSPKRKLRKLVERLAWIVILLAFVFTLIYLLKELDLSDKRFKKKASISGLFFSERVSFMTSSNISL